MIKKLITIITMILFIALNVSAQDDFKWSWEGAGAGKAGGGKAEGAKGKGQGAKGEEAVGPVPSPGDDDAVEKVDVEELPGLEADGEPVNWDWDADIKAEGAKGMGQGAKGEEGEEKLTAENGKQKEPAAQVQTVQEDQKVQGASQGSGVGSQPSSQSAAGDLALKDLLQDNLKLREQIDQMQINSKVNQQENERLVRQVAELEKNIKQLGGLIDKYNVEKKASDNDADKVVALELKLTEVESEKIRLEKEREALKEDLAGLEKRMQAMPAKVDVPQNATPGPDSDLYKRVKAENALLKAKMVEIEQNRINAVKDREAVLSKEAGFDRMIAESKSKREQLEKELNALREKREQQEKLIGKLMDQIPALENQVTKLSEKVEQSETELVRKDRDIDVYRTELERREDRLAKAEKMAALLEKTRAEVQTVNNAEKRDMHFNMAVVYSKEGRIQDAEREYLKALRLDPNDADVHYNLGILYDDELDDNRRAALHYRKYINLRPFAKDIDEVRVWLMECELE